ncbi:MAG: hypothetical protein JST00_10740 [Deltaproteobacteria bacterium]|nr:hypothetical protein [Deltaproteobacteria bacterium]
MSRLACRIASATIAAGLLLAATASPASAQQPPSQPPNAALPPTAPPPQSARAPNGEYVAPMQQQTQQIYVPQSVAMSGPRIIRDYEEGDPIPPGYHADTQMRKGLVIGGAITFGVMYLFSVIAGAAIDDSNKTRSVYNGTTYSTVPGKSEDSGTFLYIPVAGPFLQMTRTDTATGNVFLAIDGVAQAAGATMLLVGLTSPKTVLIRNDLAEVKVTPMRMGMDGSGSGLGLVGTF